MLSLNGLLITFSIGVAAALDWQSYGDVARHIITSSYPQLGWLAPRTAPIAYSAPDAIGLAAQAAPSPDQQRLNAISVDLDAMRQSVDRIAVTQEQTTRNVDQLTAGQERLTREITKLQAIEQQTHHKNSEPAPRPAPALARKSVRRSAQAPTAR
jgi:septal ring factor EnvC (AmiA/AmiB activator)